MDGRENFSQKQTKGAKEKNCFLNQRGHIKGGGSLVRPSVDHRSASSPWLGPAVWTEQRSIFPFSPFDFKISLGFRHSIFEFSPCGFVEPQIPRKAQMKKRR